MPESINMETAADAGPVDDLSPPSPLATGAVTDPNAENIDHQSSGTSGGGNGKVDGSPMMRRLRSVFSNQSDRADAGAKAEAPPKTATAASTGTETGPAMERSDINTIFSPQMSPLQQHMKNKNWGNVMDPASPHSTLKHRGFGGGGARAMTRDKFNVVERISNREVSRKPHTGLKRWEHVYQTFRGTGSRVTVSSGGISVGPSTSVVTTDGSSDAFSYESASKLHGAGFVLRILSVEQVPLRLGSSTGLQLLNRQLANMTMKILISCTMFDDKTGAVIGRTVRGMPVGIDTIVNSAIPSVSLGTELFYLTEPRKKTLVIAEIVLQCTDDRNVVVEETGLGWAALPAADDVICARGKMMTSLRSGTPRYLMFRDCIDGSPPPAMLMSSSATLIFALDRCDMLSFASDFILNDTLYTTNTIIPGLVGEQRPRRTTRDGEERSAPTAAGQKGPEDEELEDVLVMPLAQPVICPIWQLTLRGCTMVLPRGMHDEIVNCMAHRFGRRMRHSIEHNLVRYQVRLSTHNGHKFVGSAGELDATHHFSATTGECVIQVDPDTFDNGFEMLCPGDANFVCIVELWITDAIHPDDAHLHHGAAVLTETSTRTSTAAASSTGAEPAAARTTTVETTSVHTPGSSSMSMCVGWVPFDPFHSTSVFASTSRLIDRASSRDRHGKSREPGKPSEDEEEYAVHLRSGGGAWPRSDPVFNWREVMLLRDGKLPSSPSLHFFLRGSMVRDVQIAPMPHALQKEAATVIQKHVRGHKVRRDSSVERLDRGKAARPPAMKPQAGDTTDARTLSKARIEDAEDGHKKKMLKQKADDEDEMLRPRVPPPSRQTRDPPALPQTETVQPSPEEPGDILMPMDAKRERKQVVDACVGDFSVRTPYDVDYPKKKKTETAGVQYEPEEIDGGMLEPGSSDGGKAHTRGSYFSSPLHQLREPSRAIKTLLHQSGIGIGLPTDARGVQTERRRGVVPSFEYEARDDRLDDFVLQLLAVQETDKALRAGRHEDGEGLSTDRRLGDSLFFSFSFYEFGSENTGAAVLVRPTTSNDVDLGLRLLEAQPGQSAADLGSASERDGSSGAGGGGLARGLVHKFGTVSADNAGCRLQRDEHRRLFDYLLEKHLQIDVWDARTMLHVGTATVPLHGLLRQGRDVSEVLHEAAIVRHSVYVAETLGLDVGTDVGGAGRNLDSDSLRDATVGSIIVRFVNFARESSGSRADAADSGFENRSPAVTKVRPMYDLEDAKVGVSNVVLEAPEGKYAAMSINQLEQLERRKLARATRLLELKTSSKGEGAEDGEPGTSSGIERPAYNVLREKILNDVTTCRSRTRHRVIVDKLRNTFCKKMTIRPSYGEAVYIEHDVMNPYGTGVTLQVLCNSEDVRFVRDAWEWKHHRAAQGHLVSASRTGDRRVDDSLEDCVFADDVFFLHPYETTKMALKFQSFDAARFNQNPIGNLGMLSSDEAAGNEMAGKYVCKVKLVNPNSKQIVSMLELHVEPRRMVVDHSLRFHAGEHEIWRIKFSIEQMLQKYHTDLEVLNKSLSSSLRPAVTCSDRRVACELSEVKTRGASGIGHECHLRYKCGGSNEVISFYVLVYTDQFMSQVLEVLQFFVYPLRQIDIKSVTGQTSNSAMVVYGRGTRSRKVRFFSSHGDLRVTSAPVVLSPSSIVELPMTFCPRLPGLCNVFINVMDIQANELIDTVLVRSETVHPVITSNFDLILRLGSVVHKKIKLRNPYQTSRFFTMKTSHPQLLTFKEERMEMMPLEVRFVAICFDTSSGGGSGGGNRREMSRPMLDRGITGRHQVLLFVNDEEDRNEECFRIDLTVLT